MLVNSLNITEELTMGGRCEDCIFGKHSTHSFNDNRYQETEILERTHIDIWGPSPTQSAGGASYFMLLMDCKGDWGTRLQENPQFILHLVVMIQLTSRRILRD